MGTQDRDGLDEVLRLARQLANKLDSATRDVSGSEAFALRLALAHALGIVDQVSDIVGAKTPTQITALANDREDELVH